MDNRLHIALPESSPYQCGVDFTLEQDQGRISWNGAGRFEGDYCAFEAYRTVAKTAADAVFRLAIADGRDQAEALMLVFMARLPTDHLDLDYLE